jgi:predicted SAM-dependent methyltransferase
MQLKKTFYKIVTRLPFVPRHRYCEICESRVFHFIPIAKFYREHAAKYKFPYTSDDFETIDIHNFYCPKCFSFDRERLYFYYLKRMHTFKKNDLLLEFAPSPGFSKMAEKAFPVIYKTCDLYMEGVDFKLDIQDLSAIADNSVDFIICSHVLEHIPDDIKAMKNMYNILKPGGKSIMMVPILKGTDEVDEDPQCTDIAERWRRFGQDDHIRLYSRKVFVERLKEAGFEIQIIRGKDLDAKELEKYGIPLQFVLYICVKANS